MIHSCNMYHLYHQRVCVTHIIPCPSYFHPWIISHIHIHPMWLWSQIICNSYLLPQHRYRYIILIHFLTQIIPYFNVYSSNGVMPYPISTSNPCKFLFRFMNYYPETKFSHVSWRWHWIFLGVVIWGGSVWLFFQMKHHINIHVLIVRHRDIDIHEELYTHQYLPIIGGHITKLLIFISRPGI